MKEEKEKPGIYWLVPLGLIPEKKKQEKLLSK